MSTSKKNFVGNIDTRHNPDKHRNNAQNDISVTVLKHGKKNEFYLFTRKLLGV